MKINFTELEKMNREAGKETLLAKGYTQNRSEVDDKEEYSINDEYYTLFDEDGNELHVISYVTYTKDVPGDEPEYIKESEWHWSEVI